MATPQTVKRVCVLGAAHADVPLFVARCEFDAVEPFVIPPLVIEATADLLPTAPPPPRRALPSLKNAARKPPAAAAAKSKGDAPVAAKQPRRARFAAADDDAAAEAAASSAASDSARSASADSGRDVDDDDGGGGSGSDSDDSLALPNRFTEQPVRTHIFAPPADLDAFAPIYEDLLASTDLFLAVCQHPSLESLRAIREVWFPLYVGYVRNRHERLDDRIAEETAAFEALAYPKFKRTKKRLIEQLKLLRAYTPPFFIVIDHVTSKRVRRALATRSAEAAGDELAARANALADAGLGDAAAPALGGDAVGADAGAPPMHAVDGLDPAHAHALYQVIEVADLETRFQIELHSVRRRCQLPPPLCCDTRAAPGDGASAKRAADSVRRVVSHALTLTFGPNAWTARLPARADDGPLRAGRRCSVM